MNNVMFHPRKNKDYVIAVNNVPTSVTFDPKEVKALNHDGLNGVAIVASTIAHRLYCRHAIPYDAIEGIQVSIRREIDITLGCVHEWKK